MKMLNQIPVLEKELALMRKKMLQLQMMHGSLASKPKALVANSQPHATPEHSEEKALQDPYREWPLVQQLSRRHCQKARSQAPTTSACRADGISPQRGRPVSPQEVIRSLHSGSESTRPSSFSQPFHLSYLELVDDLQVGYENETVHSFADVEVDDENNARKIASSVSPTQLHC